MRKINKVVRTAAFGAALMLVALPGISAAAEHGGAKGMHEGHDHGANTAQGGHDMAKMGDKAFSGKIGPWQGDARMIDMKAKMAGSGMKAAPMPNSHHLALTITDPATKTAVTEGKGAVTVTGPDKKAVTSDFMLMSGHFGADVNLPVPGKYTVKAEVESGGKKGSATFSYTVK
jgi:hypothetical protein